ncbi:MAG: aldehyde dehydrogenase family protein [Myxococcales bacterium]|nr:aldehyde dehydrogenase family protein [Myxococcales bacterium]
MLAIERTDPATGEARDALVADDAAAVARKYEAARAAQPAWAARPFAERLACIERFRDLLAERRDGLAAIQSKETGKPIKQARGEVGATPGRLDWFIQQAEAMLAPSTRLDTPGLTEKVTWEALGVVVNVSAWNYPWFVGTNVYVPALLAGNAVLYKPSELAVDVGLSMGQLLHEAGVPADVFQVVVGGGATGAALLELPIDGVFFTGSHATGVKIAQAAAAQLIPVQLELGGKDPAYAADDVDPKATAEGLADGAFYNAGQSCCAVERIYVHEAIYGPFVEAFAAAVDGFVMGDPAHEDTYLGPLTRAAQIPVIEAQVADAVAKGAKVLRGGHRLDKPGAWFAPTVLIDVDHTMEVMREESFGPVIGIQKVSGDAEAVKLMNDTAYGLTAAVYTHDLARAQGILGALDTGTAYWNCCDRVSPRLEWTGRGHSGVGSTLGEVGIRAFVRPRAWHLRAPQG